MILYNLIVYGVLIMPAPIGQNNEVDLGNSFSFHPDAKPPLLSVFLEEEVERIKNILIDPNEIEKKDEFKCS